MVCLSCAVFIFRTCSSPSAFSLHLSQHHPRTVIHHHNKSCHALLHCSAAAADYCHMKSNPNSSQLLLADNGSTILTQSCTMTVLLSTWKATQHAGCLEKYWGDNRPRKGHRSYHQRIQSPCRKTESSELDSVQLARLISQQSTLIMPTTSARSDHNEHGQTVAYLWIHICEKTWDWSDSIYTWSGRSRSFGDHYIRVGRKFSETSHLCQWQHQKYCPQTSWPVHPLSALQVEYGVFDSMENRCGRWLVPCEVDAAL